MISISWWCGGGEEEGSHKLMMLEGSVRFSPRWVILKLSSAARFGAVRYAAKKRLMIIVLRGEPSSRIISTDNKKDCSCYSTLTRSDFLFAVPRSIPSTCVHNQFLKLFFYSPSIFESCSKGMGVVTLRSYVKNPLLDRFQRLCECCSKTTCETHRPFRWYFHAKLEFVFISLFLSEILLDNS